MSTPRVRALLDPASIAVAGAPDAPSRTGGRPIDYLGSLPDGIALFIFATQGRTVPELLKAACRKGARAAHGVDEQHFPRPGRANTRFRPAGTDGEGADGVRPKKCNGANKPDRPLFEAYAATCGITITFGVCGSTPTHRSSISSRSPSRV